MAAAQRHRRVLFRLGFLEVRYGHRAAATQRTVHERANARAAARHVRARVGVACAMMVAPFLPASGFVMPVGFAVAERIMFLPTIGFSALLVLLLQPWLRAGTQTKRLVAQFVLLLSVVLGGRRTLARNPEWSSQETLYVSTLRDYPDNAKVRVHVCAQPSHTDVYACH